MIIPVGTKSNPVLLRDKATVSITAAGKSYLILPVCASHVLLIALLSVQRPPWAGLSEVPVISYFYGEGN